MTRLAIATTLSVALIAGSCAPHRETPPVRTPTTAASPAAVRLAVGVRELRLARGADRPLRTLVLFPAVPTGRNPLPRPAPAIVTPRADVTPLPGRFPLVLFSHGLHGSPERYSPAAASWAAAGFVVALPAYPHTSKKADPYIRSDFVNQPADAEYVLREVLKLAGTAGDPLRGHIDTARIAAVGHSAGGYTTTGLFRSGHTARLKAGVVIAGWLAPGAYGGPPARMLFVHADNDKTIPIADGRAAYDRVPWAGKSFELLPGAGHAAYMLPGKPGYAEMDRLVTNFLSATLGREQQAPLQRG